MRTETFGRRLFLLRVGSGLSQQKVADGINAATGKHINKSMISRWENNAGLPTVENAVALARFFGCTLEYLVNGTPEGEKNTGRRKEQ